MNLKLHFIVSVVFSISLSLQLLFGGASMARADSQTIILAADSWFPFNGDPESKEPGYMIDVAKKIFESRGYKIDYKIMPWTRAIAEMLAGRIDGIIGATKEEAKAAIYPEECLGMASNSFFTRSDSNWKFSDEASLSQVILGGIRDYAYGDLIQTYIKKNSNVSNLVQLSSGDSALEQNIKKLLAQRIGAIVETPEVFWNTVKEMGMSKIQFKEAGSAGEKEPIYITFSPKKENSRMLAELLSNGIVELRKSGELMQILARYGLEDWK